MTSTNTRFTFGNTPVPSATTAVPTVFNPTFTFGNSATSQLVATGLQNTTTINPFGNAAASTTPANITTTTGFGGTSLFGTNQTATKSTSIFGVPPATQTTNVVGLTSTGTTIKFAPMSAQATFPTTTTTSNIFGNNNNNTATTSTPFTFGTNTTPVMSVFGVPSSATSSPFAAATLATTLAKNPFDAKPNTAQSTLNFPTNTSTSTPFVFGPQSGTSTNIFSQPMTATPFNGTIPITTKNIFGVPTTSTIAAPTITSLSTAFNSGAPISTTTNIFGVPSIPSATTISNLNGIETQTAVPSTIAPFSFASSATSILNTDATKIASAFNPQLSTGLSVTQSQPVVTTISQPQTQEENTKQSISMIQQQFLAVSLLDPYASRGKKNFNNINQIQPSTESNIVSTLSTTNVTTSIPTPITLPIQTNSRKISSSRSLVDVNFKLKPVSSSPTPNNDNIKSSHQQSIRQIQNSLSSGFTEEEELMLLNQNKMSKLRLSNDIINLSLQSESIRSLYPLRCLAELEKLTNITTINNQQTLSSSNEILPIHHVTPLITHEQSLSPILPHESNTYKLPILTRDNYYMKPTISELKSLFNDKGQCIVKQFTVEHEKYGSITFYGQINVAGLNLDEIIEINHHEVIVYPDNNNKPSIGEELNRSARITLFNIYPIDRTTREEITDVERIKAMNYNDYLCEITKKFDGQFINYEMNSGSWTFMVKHFTRYGLDVNEK